MEGAVLSPNINPLFIDHILEKVLENFVPEHHSLLLQSRLVCNQWNFLASKALQHHSDEVISFGKFFNPPQSIKAFLEVVQGQNFPIHNFRLCQDVFQPCNEPLLKDFFRKCNPILSSLVIRLDHESTLQVDKCLPPLSLPRLKTLIYDDRRNLSESFDLLSVLLGSTNNLETLSLHQQAESQIQFGDLAVKEEFIRRVCTIIRQSHIPKLKHLQIDLELNDELLSSLTECVKGIRNLSVCLRLSSFHADSLNKFLKCQENTLEKLKLCGICRKSSFEIAFPKLAGLESLEVHGWDSIVPHVHFSKFSHQGNFPGLKTLILNTWVDEPSWCQFIQGENGSLRRLKLPQELLNSGLIQNLTSSFRNLRSLELNYTEDSGPVFEKVFKFLVQLEELKINQDFRGRHKTKYIDSLLTGLPTNVCRHILRRRTFDEPLPLRIAFNVKPGLANLENLKVLDMSDLLKYQACITDVSGYMVLMKMKNLERLKIRRSKIQPECFKLLLVRFPQDLSKELDQPVDDSDVTLYSKYYKKAVGLNYCNIS